MGQQSRYADDEHLHAAHLTELQQRHEEQREQQRGIEVAHHAHLAELQQHQRQVEAEHLFEMQQQEENTWLI